MLVCVPCVVSAEISVGCFAMLSSLFFVFCVDVDKEETRHLNDVNIGEKWIGNDSKWKSQLSRQRAEAIKKLQGNTELHLAARFNKCKFAPFCKIMKRA